MPQDPVEDLDERREEMDHADQFPFLRLPNELIDKTISFASMKDRMNARVCKRMHTIEAETKCFIKELYIIEKKYSWMEKEGAQYIICDASFSRDFMRFLDRVSNNASIGDLKIGICLRNGVSSQVVCDFYNIIKKFDAKNVIFGLRAMTDDLPERFLIDMAAKCNFLNLGGQVPNATALHEVYKGMVDGSLTLRKLISFSTPIVTSRNFFELFGIRHGWGGELFSNRDIEVYSQDQYRYQYFIFDGDLIIESSSHGFLRMTRHETPESLEEAKNKVRNKEGMERVDVAPIEE